jgi:hypothetical protein
MRINYDTNTITFPSLDDVQAVKEYYTEPFINISYHDGIGGKITFSEIEPYKYTANKGEQNEVEKFIDYSDKFSWSLGNKEGVFYQNKLSIPVASDPNEPSYITLPNVYEEDDKRLENIVLCNYAVDSGLYYLTAFDPSQYTDYEVYYRVNEDGVLVKFNVYLTPIDYHNLDLFRTILVNGQRAYIKELTYKPDAKSEITAYLV